MIIEGWFLDRLELTIRPVTGIERIDNTVLFRWFTDKSPRGQTPVACVNKVDVFATAAEAAAAILKTLEL